MDFLKIGWGTHRIIQINVFGCKNIKWIRRVRDHHRCWGLKIWIFLRLGSLLRNRTHLRCILLRMILVWATTSHLLKPFLITGLSNKLGFIRDFPREIPEEMAIFVAPLAHKRNMLIVEWLDPGGTMVYHLDSLRYRLGYVHKNTNLGEGCMKDPFCYLWNFNELANGVAYSLQDIVLPKCIW